MKRFARILIAIWVFNFWLWMVFISPSSFPGAYESMRAAGVQWFTCMDWDANGHPFESDQCTDAPPAYDPVQ